MNIIVVPLLLCALQATLFAIPAVLLYACMRKCSAQSRSRVLTCGFGILIAIWIVAFLPFPSWISRDHLRTATIDSVDKQNEKTNRSYQSNVMGGPGESAFRPMRKFRGRDRNF